MSDFPTLKTGAIAQYPADRETRFSTQVVRFVDGSEQRFRNFGAALHRWVVRLDHMDETELSGLREFFRTQRGPAGTFSFTDPWTDTEYAICSIETDQMLEEFLDSSRGRTTLVVKEGRT